jgi:hypothetical protein
MTIWTGNLPCLQNTLIMKVKCDKWNVVLKVIEMLYYAMLYFQSLRLCILILLPVIRSLMSNKLCLCFYFLNFKYKLLEII